MALIGVLIAFTPLTTAKSADVNSNFSAIQSAFNTSAVLTDVAKTIAVSHTFSVAQTMNGILFGTDNASDIGASGASRPRTVYVATSLVVPTVTATTGTFSGHVSGVGLDAGGAGITSAGGLTVSAGTSTLLATNVQGTLSVQTVNPTIQLVQGTRTWGLQIDASGALYVTDYTANASRWKWDPSGHYLTQADNAYDIGASGASRPRNLYVAGAGVFGGSLTTNQITANGALPHVLAQNGSSASYATIRLYNDQNVGTRALEIDYSGSAYGGALLLNGPTGESAAIYTTGAYPLAFGTSAIARWLLHAGGNLLAATDNTYDIGQSAANRPRNIYAAGSIYSASSRALKEQIRPSRVDALALVKRTRVVDFRYKANPAREKIGFIAEDTDPLLSGPAQKDFDVNNAIGVLLRANQQLLDRVEQLELEQRRAA